MKIVSMITCIDDLGFHPWKWTFNIKTKKKHAFLNLLFTPLNFNDKLRKIGGNVEVEEIVWNGARQIW